MFLKKSLNQLITYLDALCREVWLCRVFLKQPTKEHIMALIRTYLKDSFFSDKFFSTKFDVAGQFFSPGRLR